MLGVILLLLKAPFISGWDLYTPSPNSLDVQFYSSLGGRVKVKLCLIRLTFEVQELVHKLTLHHFSTGGQAGEE